MDMKTLAPRTFEDAQQAAQQRCVRVEMKGVDPVYVRPGPVVDILRIAHQRNPLIPTDGEVRVNGEVLSHLACVECGSTLLIS